MRSDLSEDFLGRPEQLVERIQRGENEQREVLIDMNRTVIATIVSRIIKATVYGQCWQDEFSVALSAFNEAIDSYNPAKGQSFLGFAELVINRRIIDYMRQNSKNRNVYPFTYFEVDGNDGQLDRIIDEHPTILVENIEIKEEIMMFERQLLAFGIQLSELVDKSPRHLDTRQLCVAMAKQIVGSPELSMRLQNTGRLPAAELARIFGVSRKTMDKHRKYIIALCIILTGKLETIKGYIDFLPQKSL